MDGYRLDGRPTGLGHKGGFHRFGRMRNIDIWESTVELCTSGRFKTKIPSPSYKYNEQILTSTIKLKPKYDADIQVHNIDTLDAMESLVDQAYNPLILNMANHLNPGGGVRNGAHAQEEQLFKVTNSFKTLTYDLYPIQDNEIIYTPKIHQIRDSSYNILPTARKFSMISVAALRNPILDKGIYNDFDRNMMKQKIQMIFHIAALNGHDTLVLGALGCGAFHNPPEEVCNLFIEVMADYSSYFKGLIFAVKSTGLNQNYDIFNWLLLGGPNPNETNNEETEYIMSLCDEDLAAYYADNSDNSDSSSENIEEWEQEWLELLKEHNEEDLLDSDLI